MKTCHTDVLIVGAGPAGLAASLALARRSVAGRVVVVDLGRPYEKRKCPVDSGGACNGCGGTCNVISGFGGSIHYGDGVKLSRFPSGRRLVEHIGTDANVFQDEALKYLSAKPGDIAFSDPIGQLFPFDLRTYPVATVPPALVKDIVERLHSSVNKLENTEIHLGTEVTRIENHNSGFEVVAYGPSREPIAYHCRSLLVGIGRAGFLWWRSELRRLQLTHTAPSMAVGLRFECPSNFLRVAAKAHADFKTTMYVNNIKIKTFCFCADASTGGGRLKFTRYPSFTLLDGHVTTDNTPTANFGLLAQVTDPDGKPRSFEWVREHILKPYKALRDDQSSKPVVQWYPDFRDKCLRHDNLSALTHALGYAPSVRDVRVADLSGLVGEYHEAFCVAFETLIDSFAESNGLQVDSRTPAETFAVYGLELESVWDLLDLTPGFESRQAPGLFAIGDCAGVAQGILQAMVSGISAAHSLSGKTFDI